MPYSRETVQRIAERHGIAGEIDLLPNGGMVNEAWRIGEFILRICRGEYGKNEAEREVSIAPLIAESSVRAPRLVAFDLQPQLTAFPYTIYERAKGELLGYCEIEPLSLSESYREIGREIARLGRIPLPPTIDPPLKDGEAPGTWHMLAKVIAYDVLSKGEGKEIASWIEFMEPLAGKPSSHVLIHKDIHPWNVFVDAEEDRLEAIIDWGDVSVGDPAIEFASMPLETMPALLSGFSEEGATVDSGFVARSLLAGLALSLWEIRKLPVADFARPWWRTPRGGWEETKELIGRLWPEFAKF